MIELYGSQVLKEKATAVEVFNDELKDTVEEMFRVMKKAQGVGLAAPQIGLSKRFFVTEAQDDQKRVFINPTIIETSIDEVEYEEGCLSVPKIWAKVVRPKDLKIQAQDVNGKYFKLSATGILARVILHEYDHLNGILFVDHLSAIERSKIEKKLTRIASTKK